MATSIDCSFLLDHKTHHDVYVGMAAADYHFLIRGGGMKSYWIPARIHLDQIGMLGHLCHSTRNWFSHFQTTCWSNDDPHVAADQNKKKLLKNVLVLFKECFQSGLKDLSWNLLRHKTFKRYSKEECLKSLTAQNTTSSKVYHQKT